MDSKKQKKFEPKKGGDNLHFKLTGPASMGTGGGVKGDRGIFYGNIETAVSDNTRVKSPAKFIGALGMTKGLLGGVRDVIQNKKAATAAGQDYSFKEGLGDFAVGGLNQVLGPNRGGTPAREFQQPNMEFPGQMSAQQMEQFMKMFNMAQNMNAPTQMKSPNKLKYKK
jgi:hypothetical protein